MDGELLLGHSACSRLIRNISKIQSQLKNDTSRTKRFRISRISGESRSQSAGIESGPQGPLSYQSVCLDPGPARCEMASWPLLRLLAYATRVR
jgi:hypothetical protein